MEKRLPLPVGTILQARYRIARQLGHGGFGAVYEAVDDEINLSFALKETFYAADEELRQAFKREARMLARLSHEAFPRVTHYFTEGDGCFLVMELIEGDDLDKLLSKRRAPFEREQVLMWADQILDALEDLHEKGIVHRDIKPSNLKLTTRGKIKLLDFGIAKGAVEGETTLLTTVGSLAAATLQYAPLEQVLKASPQYQMMLSVTASDEVMEIMRRGTDATSDLYALAATLYHLLTGQLPADAPTRALAVWSGQNDRLIPAHEINSQVEREVSEVLQKAMSLNRTERYQTAAEMRQALKESEKTAAEIKPEPVPPTEPAPTAHRFVEPETEVLSPLSEVKTVKSNSQTESPQTPDLSELLYQNNSDKKVSQPEATRPSDSHKPIDKHNIELPNTKKRQRASIISRRRFLIISIILPLLLITGLGIYFLNRGRPFKTLVGHESAVDSIAFSPDGRAIVSGGGNVILWDAASGNIKLTLTGYAPVAFSPDGKVFAIENEASIKLIDVASGNIKQTFIGYGAAYDYGVESFAFSPDGKALASAHQDGKIRLWDVESGNYKQTLTGHGTYLKSVAFSPDGKTIASGGWDKTIKLWDATSGSLKQTITDSNYVESIAFSPDGKFLASGGWAGIKLWNAANGNLELTITNSVSIKSIAFSPDGKTITGAGSLYANTRSLWDDGETINLWDATNGNLKKVFGGGDYPALSVAFSPDGKIIASGSSDKTIKLWRVE